LGEHGNGVGDEVAGEEEASGVHGEKQGGLGVGGGAGVAAGEDPGGEGRFGDADGGKEPGAAEGDFGDDAGVVGGSKQLEPEPLIEPDGGEGEAGDQEIVIRTHVRTPTR
jgi:hypothetical protein